MRKARYAACIWPGLPQLWFAGAWSGLALALGFTCLYCVVLAATSTWTELLPPAAKRLAWWTLGSAWLAAVACNYRWQIRHNAIHADRPPDDLFPAALNEYLQGNWCLAEDHCRSLLVRNGRDAPALLLLASTLRRAGRPDEARKTLSFLALCEAGKEWSRELARERQLLDEFDAQAVPDSPVGEAAQAQAAASH